MHQPAGSWPGALGALALACCLGACAVLGPRHQGGSEPVEGVDRELTGRISVHYHVFSTDHEETVFANFDWSERGPDVDLDLLDPLGQSIARVRAAPGASTLTLRDGRVFSGPSPEALTLQVLGWTLPVGGLRAWLEGRAANPETPLATLDADGNRRLVENGWTIVYMKEEGVSQPRRLNLSYPGPGISLDLRIVIDTRSGA